MPLNEHAKCLVSGDLDLADQESRKPVTQNDEHAERRPVTGTIAISIRAFASCGYDANWVDCVNTRQKNKP